MTEQNSTRDVYVLMVSMPGYLPNSEPYAVRGVDEAYDAAKDEYDRSEDFDYPDAARDSFPSREDFGVSLAAGGVSVLLDEWNYLDVTPLDSLGLGPDDVELYLSELD